MCVCSFPQVASPESKKTYSLRILPNAMKPQRCYHVNESEEEEEEGRKVGEASCMTGFGKDSLQLALRGTVASRRWCFAVSLKA